jgi:hypothetical protein
MRHHLILSKVHMTSKRFRVTDSHASVRGQHRKVLPFGTTFRFALSERASVRIEITDMSGGRCKGRTGPCAHPRVVGTLTYAGEHAGNDSFVFHGQVGKQVLHPGHYLATVSAHNRSGRSKPALVSFVVAQ